MKYASIEKIREAVQKIQLDGQMKQRLYDLLCKNHRNFTNFRGIFNKFEYHIQLNTEGSLVKHNYPIPVIYHDQIRSQIRKLLDLGVIKPGLSKNS